MTHTKNNHMMRDQRLMKRRLRKTGSTLLKDVPIVPVMGEVVFMLGNWEEKKPDRTMSPFAEVDEKYVQQDRATRIHCTTDLFQTRLDMSDTAMNKEHESRLDMKGGDHHSFRPEASQYDIHKEDHGFVSQDGKWMLVITGQPYARVRSVIPPLQSQQHGESSYNHQGKMNCEAENKVRYHLAVCMTRQKPDDEWRVAEFDDFMEEPSLPKQLRKSLADKKGSEKSVHEKRSRDLYHYGAKNLVQCVFKGQIENITNLVKSLSFARQRVNTGEVVNVCKPIEVPFLDRDKVNNLVTHHSRHTVIEKLRGVGTIVIEPKSDRTKDHDAAWDILAGYHPQKELLKEIVYSATNPIAADIIKEVTKASTGKASHDYPDALLLYGPSGTGKTLAAKVISDVAGIPFIQIEVSTLASKWQGRSSHLVLDIFSLIKLLGELRGAAGITGPKSLVFMDEVDAIATDRDRIQSKAGDQRAIVNGILEQLDGVAEKGAGAADFMYVCCTNKKDALDKAFLSRMKSQIEFGSPKRNERAEIFATHAKHLTPSECDILAGLTGNADDTYALAGREIKNVCVSAVAEGAVRVIKSLESKGFDYSNVQTLSNGGIKPILEDYTNVITTTWNGRQRSDGLQADQQASNDRFANLLKLLE